jgi:hypothetical protein
VVDSQQYSEKRNYERYHVNVPAELSFGGESIECSAIDISEGGAKIRFKSDPFKKIILSIPPFGEIEGEVIWKDEEYVGIKFIGDQGRMVEIIDTIVASNKR